jgi:3'-5' exoribonuclease
MEQTYFSGKNKSSEFLVSNLKIGQRIFERFILANNPVLRKTRTGLPYFILEMGDTTGVIKVYVWRVPNDSYEAELEKLKSGKIYVLSGIVSEYNSVLKIDIEWQHFVNHFRLCDEDEFNKNDFLMVKKSVRDLEAMYKKIVQLVESVENITYRNICQLFFDDSDWVGNFKKAVAAKGKHHNWIGGMVEHIYGMLQIMEVMCELHPSLNRELLITAIVFHDLSKMDDYIYDLNIRMTDHEEVLLAGHMATAQMEIERRLFSSDLEYDLDALRVLLHLIHSHHGPVANGWGSSVSPMLPEAYVLHHIDNLDAKAVESLSK